MARAWTLIALSVAALVGAPESRASRELAFEFTELGRFTSLGIRSCGVAVHANSGSLRVLDGFGLGLDGDGPESSLLDGQEVLTVSVDNRTPDLSYEVVDAGNENGTGPPGEAWLTAYRGFNVPIGTVGVSGTGVVDVGALFPGETIKFFELEARGDSQRIGSVTWRPRFPWVREIRFAEFPGHQPTSMSFCGVTVSGSNAVQAGSGGLGVVGFSNNHVDGSEWVEFLFDAPQTQVWMRHNGVTNGDPDVTSGEGTLEIWGADDEFLRAVLLNGPVHYDVSAFVDDAPILRFRYNARDGDGRRIFSIETPEPASAAAALAALAALAGWRRVARRRRRA